MNGKASPASFATEDLRLELDIAKDREDGKGFTGLEITWLGTSSGAPTFSRNVSATAVRTKDEVWLFDCGEATQHRMLQTTLAPPSLAAALVAALVAAQARHAPRPVRRAATVNAL